MLELKFIDLFSGIGAFHLALKDFNGECLLASEIDKFAIDTYKTNFNIDSNHNIRDIDEKDIPDHDILCGGFPCFVAGTKVLTKDGYKNIEDIKVGELVLTHKNRYQKVLRTGSTPNQLITEMITLNEKKFYVTDNHPFYISNIKEIHFTDPIFKEVKDIEPIKDYLVGFSVDRKIHTFDKVVCLVRDYKRETVYNLEVEEDNTYIVDGVIVHNCQAFSVAGKGLGFQDKTRGTLFFEIARILNEKHPKYILLENVKNLVTHDDGKTYYTIIQTLIDLGYVLPKDPIIMSPTQLGIPQKRERVFILGIHKDYCDKEYLEITLPKEQETSIYDILEDKVDKKYNISKYEEKILTAWNEFHKNIPNHFGVIWVEEFKTTYDTSNLPDWKQKYIQKNRDLYKNNKEFIDNWMKKYDVENFKLRDKKFEWQSGTDCNDIWDTVIQLRQSGIRCKRPNHFQTLVAMVQTPIIGKYKRRLTPREAARLQSFPDSYILNERDDKAYKQLGNSANVEVIKYLLNELLKN